ncbi:MAG TPA: hypothetical protein VK742_19220 [Candidatus Sulfotelmatobacter sp.]|jgi:hypothetical protein|nr:hypothetical protein [Candidatus Sulfotelmatobacter sp.]
MKSHWIRLLLWSLVVVCVAGCGTLSKHASRRVAVAKLNLARQGALVCIMYAGDHGGQYPPNLSATASYFNGNTNSLNDLIAGFDLVYSGADTNIIKPAETIVIRQKQAWQRGGGNWLKAYAFADGHAEIHASPNGNFDDWEKAGLIKP